MPMKPRAVEKAKNPKETLFRLMKRVIGSYPVSCTVVLLCIIGSAVAMIYGILFMQTLVDDYIVPLSQSSAPDFGSLAIALGKVGVICGAGVLCMYIQNRVMVNVTQGTLRNLRNDLFLHMEQLPISYFDTHAHGDLMSIYTNDTDTLRQMISQSIPQLISSLLNIVLVFFSMITLDIPLTGVTLVMIAVMGMVMKTLGGKSGSYFIRQQNDLGKVNGYIEEMMNGQKVIKVFCHEEKTLADFRKMNDDLRDSANNANKFANILMPICGNLGNISFVLCAVIGALMALSQVTSVNIHGWSVLSLGMLVSFMTLNRSFSMPVIQFSQQINSVVMALAGADRIFNLLDEQPEVDEGYVELVHAREDQDGTLTESAERTGLWAWKHPHQADGTVTYTKLQGHVVFDDVDFGYVPEKIVLHHVDLYAEPGQKIAFVGSTGAGKTTITNLINRFYDIQDGKIRYDGININKIKKADLRRSLGIVLQETHLFTGTVMENIRYGRLDATDEECISAARLANADGFITRLPNGYDTMLTGDGSNLSQGQRQLLAIARAAVADPPVLILDEATSSIDTRTETLVQQGMDQLMKGRTTFVIAHRLSTVRNSDCIMVLERGCVIERGSHEDLIAKKGKYYQLYTGNFPEETA